MHQYSTYRWGVIGVHEHIADGVARAYDYESPVVDISVCVATVLGRFVMATLQSRSSTVYSSGKATCAADGTSESRGCPQPGLSRL